MSYTAKNLEEIAALFVERANRAEAEIPKARTLVDTASAAVEATTWLLAAGILRCTTLTEPCHMVSDADTARRNA